MKTTRELFEGQGWSQVPAADGTYYHWTDGHLYVLVMRHPTKELFNARVEGTNFPDACFMVTSRTLGDALSAAINYCKP